MRWPLLQVITAGTPNTTPRKTNTSKRSITDPSYLLSVRYQ
jgi:hypothetical protein